MNYTRADVIAARRKAADALSPEAALKASLKPNSKPVKFKRDTKTGKFTKKKGA